VSTNPDSPRQKCQLVSGGACVVTLFARIYDIYTCNLNFTFVLIICVSGHVLRICLENTMDAFHSGSVENLKVRFDVRGYRLCLIFDKQQGTIPIHSEKFRMYVHIFMKCKISVPYL